MKFQEHILYNVLLQFVIINQKKWFYQKHYGEFFGNRKFLYVFIICF